MNRPPGLSARLKLTLSYAGFLILAGGLLLAVVWVFLLRYVPDNAFVTKPRLGRYGAPSPQFMPDRSDLLRAFAPRAAQAMAFLLVFGLLGGWILAGRMLAPLARITDAARLAADGSLSHRIRLHGRRDEFRELADVFDTMLQQLESHVREQQRFAANASHELRTPLAISQALLDVARNDPARDQGELIQRLYTVNTRAIDLTEALLLLSRGNSRSFTREPVDLSLVAEQAAETLLPLAEQRRITLDVTGETAMANGSAELLLRMVTNLVQNAIVHNLPTGGTVTVHTEPQHDASMLRVENTGHEVPAELLPTLTEPFQRGTQRVHTNEHAGVGLGLAIVHSIVRAHDGTLDLTPRPTGGLRVTIRLPRTPQASSPHEAR
ncbi:sensor histidine kinase [Actinomadura latina]|uniref:histidine kinase n=1 Tax=Actinomadura latina TaxID=163603 RepID=A0A846YV43_9ACTN|nr:HAMP domain-containing sensor histidine kinase [Actinomadura latina]NKZ04289.1 HAMP domain-containing histidine kinase [Actinomadura latina]